MRAFCRGRRQGPFSSEARFAFHVFLASNICCICQANVCVCVCGVKVHDFGCAKVITWYSHENRISRNADSQKAELSWPGKCMLHFPGQVLWRRRTLFDMFFSIGDANRVENAFPILFLRFCDDNRYLYIFFCCIYFFWPAFACTVPCIYQQLYRAFLAPYSYLKED